MADDPKTGPRSRSARKRRAILDVATELFLADGYQGTSMDKIAAAAAVSKQTIYKNFASKDRLAAAILDGLTGRVEEFIEAAVHALGDSDDVEGDLRRLARRHIATVLQPEVLQLRQLVIAEAVRHPELARGYYAGVPRRMLDALAAAFEALAGRGRLAVEDPRLAAGHFAFLVLGEPLDRAMFHGHDESLSAADLDRLADEGVRAFLAAYGR
jgi:TetR/AcrR family transcriptional repressor of mexJK operon